MFPETRLDRGTGAASRAALYSCEVLVFGLSYKTTTADVTAALARQVPDVRYVSQSPYGLVYAVRCQEEAEKLILGSPYPVEENFVGVCRQIRQSPPPVVPRVYSTRRTHSNARQACLVAALLSAALCAVVSWVTDEGRLVWSVYAVPAAGSALLGVAYLCLRFPWLFGRSAQRA